MNEKHNQERGKITSLMRQGVQRLFFNLDTLDIQMQRFQELLYKILKEDFLKITLKKGERNEGFRFKRYTHNEVIE